MINWIVYACRKCGRISNAWPRNSTAGCPCGEPWYDRDSYNLDALLRVVDAARADHLRGQCSDLDEAIEALDQEADDE